MPFKCERCKVPKGSSSKWSYTSIVLQHTLSKIGIWILTQISAYFFIKFQNIYIIFCSKNMTSEWTVAVCFLGKNLLSTCKMINPFSALYKSLPFLYFCFVIYFIWILRNLHFFKRLQIIQPFTGNSGNIVVVQLSAK